MNNKVDQMREAALGRHITRAVAKVESAVLATLAKMDAERKRVRDVCVVAPADLMPVRATAGAAGFDLKSAVSRDLEPGERSRVPTGVRIALPAGHEAQVRPRSGLSLRGLDTIVGTLDEDYRGEISVVVVNNTGANFAITRGDRIAQLVIARLAPVRMVVCAELDETARGENGFGHSGMR